MSHDPCGLEPLSSGLFIEWEPNVGGRVTWEVMVESGIEGRSLLPLSTLLVLGESAEGL